MIALCSSCSAQFSPGSTNSPLCWSCSLIRRHSPNGVVSGPAPVSPTPARTVPNRTPVLPDQDPIPLHGRERTDAAGAAGKAVKAAPNPVRAGLRWPRRLVVAMVAVLAMFATLNVWTPPASRFMHDNGPYMHQYVSVDHISRYILAATVLHEDDQLGLRTQPFHWGDFVERIRDHRAGRPQKTFSTIPQQLAKNMFFTPEPSGVRKALEIVPTTLLNYTLPDSRILELYVNYAEYGQDLFGVCAATWYYFDEPPWNVTADQAAILSGMLPNPKDVDRLTGGGVWHPASAAYPSAGYLINGALNVDIPQRLAAWGGWEPVMESIGIDDTAADHAADRSAPHACSTMPDGVRQRLAIEDPGFDSKW